MSKKRVIFAGLLFSLIFLVGADSAFAQRNRKSVKSATWQTSVNDQNRRNVVLGVRDKWGTLGSYRATFVVAAPGRKTFRGQTSTRGDEWAYINFPDDFNVNPLANGTYSVVFYVEGVRVGRDRFRYRR